VENGAAFSTGTLAWGALTPALSQRERGFSTEDQRRSVENGAAFSTGDFGMGRPHPSPLPEGEVVVRVIIRSLLALKIAGDRHKPVRIG